MLGHERLQESHRLGRPLGGEQCGSAPLHSDPSQLLEPERLDPGEVGVAEPVVGPAAPEPQRPAQGVRGLGGRQVPRLLDQRLEHLAVELAGVQVEQVTGVARDERHRGH